MRKLINDPLAFVDELVGGILRAHPALVKTPGTDSQRGKSQVGDETILDAMFPAAEALLAPPEAETGLDAAIRAAEAGVARSTELQAKRGRAAWLQERSKGLQDPGATAFLRFLQAWRAANQSPVTEGSQLRAEHRQLDAITGGVRAEP